MSISFSLFSDNTICCHSSNSTWLILAIIGVRIYVDNFTRRMNDSTKIETGDYKTTPYTRYMIFCGGYLLNVPTFVYLILNKYWFFEIYSFIGTKQDHEISLSVKLLAFVRDPIAYILVILQVVPFVTGFWKTYHLHTRDKQNSYKYFTKLGTRLWLNNLINMLGIP